MMICDRQKGKSPASAPTRTLLIDLLVNHPLWVTSTVATAIALKEGIHLLLGNGNLVIRHEPANALCARRGGQAALVGEVVLQTTSFLDGQVHVEADILDHGAAVRTWDHGDAHEAGGGGADVDKDTDHCGRLAGGIDVHEVQLALGAAPSEQVLRGKVHVPAAKVDGLTVEVEGGQAGEAVGGVQGVGGSEAPVEQVALDGAVVVGEGWFVGFG
jgi:hypothetical protein